MSQNHHKIDPVCPVDSMTQVPLTSEPITPSPVEINFIKVPVVLVETKIQIVVEADIPLDPPAFEIKRVGKDVFLTQCKLVPVEFRTAGEDRFVTKAMLEKFITKVAPCLKGNRDRVLFKALFIVSYLI